MLIKSFFADVEEELIEGSILELLDHNRKQTYIHGKLIFYSQSIPKVTGSGLTIDTVSNSSILP